MAWRIYAADLICILAIQLLTQAFGITNDTTISQAVVPDFSVQGKIYSEKLNPTRSDLLDVDAVTNSLYLSPLTFRSNYDEMLEKFKIYIYPRKQQDFGSPEWCGDQRFRDLDKHGASFYENLISSDFVTDDPEKAHLFFLPFSLDASGTKSTASVSRFLRRYIDDLKSQYPFWSRTLGADHFYFSCEGILTDSSRSVVELKKNAIQISCYPLALSVEGAKARFFPHKDISMPPVESVTDVHQTPKLQQSDGESRTIFAYHVGAPAGLDSVLQLWKNDPDFVLDPLLPEPNLYFQRLSSSRFCLIFFGDGGNSSILVDAVKFGCIPVIIAQGPLFDVPFQDILNWQEFVIILNMRQLKENKISNC
ncbi:hypothetical protein SUGI_0646630 [Cryptomeria japonica]|nr:hypothetical protein SUGI_0646630 [Cryptomeria japonica]